MKYSLLIALLTLTGMSVQAVEIDAKLYSKINVTHNQIDNGDDDWKSNNSNIGVKGKYNLTDTIDIVFQVEEGVDVAHGGTQQDTLFNTRNTYIGFKGAFGQFAFGTHDTPLKKSQGKIDQFNNLSADIKTALVGEVRSRDGYMYSSPKLGDAYQINAMYIPSDSNFDDSLSVSGTYTQGKWFGSVSFDSGMRKNDKTVAKTKVYDTIRAGVGYKFGAWQVGAIYQLSEQQNAVAADRESGYILSTAYSYNKFKIRGQIGRSDIVKAGGETYALGIDYKLFDKVKVFTNYFNIEDDNGDNNVVEFGAEFKI